MTDYVYKVWQRPDEPPWNGRWGFTIGTRIDETNVIREIPFQLTGSEEYWPADEHEAIQCALGAIEFQERSRRSAEARKVEWRDA